MHNSWGNLSKIIYPYSEPVHTLIINLFGYQTQILGRGTLRAAAFRTSKRFVKSYVKHLYKSMVSI